MLEGRSALIAITTGSECGKAFLMKFLGAERVVIAHIIDAERLQLSGAGLQEFMKESERITSSMEQQLRMKGIRTKVYREWGSFLEKVPNIARREGIEEVWVQECKANREEVERLRKVKGITVKAA